MTIFTRARTRHRAVRRITSGLTGLLSAGVLLALAGCGGGGGGDNTTATGGNGNGGQNSNSPPLLTTGQEVTQPNWTVRSVTKVQPRRKWTVLVYMNGANDLQTYGVLNMNQMEAVGSSNDVNIVTEFKRANFGSTAYDGNNVKWTDTRRFFVRQDNDQNTINSQLISQRGDVNMGAASSLQDFVQWGATAFPADHYALVVWNHGAGWRAFKPGQKTTRGVSYDWSLNGQPHINTIQLPSAIALPNGAKWDLLAWDASLMQMAEVAYEVRNQTSYIVGSEESPPGEGYPYDRILGQLVANPNMSGRDLGTAFAQNGVSAYADTNYQNQWNTEITGNTTQSVLDTSKLDALAPAINNLGNALSAAQNNFYSQVQDVRDSSENYEYPENKDIVDFCRRLTGGISDAGVQSAAGQLQNAVGAAVVYNAKGTGHANSTGLAIFLPTPSQYRAIDTEQTQPITSFSGGFDGQRYGELSLSKVAPNWQAFLINGPR